MLIDIGSAAQTRKEGWELQCKHTAQGGDLQSIKIRLHGSCLWAAEAIFNDELFLNNCCISNYQNTLIKLFTINKLNVLI